MKSGCVCFVLCVCAFCGCGKKASPTAGEPQLTPEQAAQIESQYVLPTNEPAAAAPISPNPAPGQPQPAQPAAVVQQPIQQRLSGAIHAQLTIELRRYIEKNGHLPDNFSELINATMDSAPPAPNGMKFVIDPVDRAVKVVKK